MNKFNTNFTTPIVLFIIAFNCFCFSIESDKILLEINSEIEELERKIDNDELQEFEVKHFTYLESGPSQLQFFLENDKLRVVFLKIPHETWANRFCYYFDKDEKIMKFLKVTLYREDKPPRGALFFNKKGEILWKNLDRIPIDANEIRSKIKALYKILTSMEKIFARK